MSLAIDPSRASLVLAALWVILALLLPLVARRRRNMTNWLLCATGVPVLGWLTLHWGPAAGLAAFAAGAALVAWPSLRRRPRLDPSAHHGPAE